MGLLEGSLSVRRYRVVKRDGRSLGEITDAQGSMALRRYAFKPPQVERGERESFGWVNPLDLLATSFGWEDAVDGHLVVLAVRRDVKRVHRGLLRARVAAASAEIQRAKSRRLTRQERVAVAEECEHAMLAEASCSTTVTELVWDRNLGEVYVAACSDALCGRIVDLLEATFDLTLQRASTAAQLVDRLEDEHAWAGWLTWLLWASHEDGEAQIAPAGRVWLSGGGAAQTVAVAGGEEAGDAAEVDAALREGKLANRSAVTITADGAQWRATLDATGDLRGVRLPVPKTPDAREHLVLRVQALQALYEILDESVQEFGEVWADRSHREEWLRQLRDRALASSAADGLCAIMEQPRPGPKALAHPAYYTEGVAAGLKGSTSLDVPYPLGSEAATAWLLGQGHGESKRESGQQAQPSTA